MYSNALFRLRTTAPHLVCIHTYTYNVTYTYTYTYAYTYTNTYTLHGPGTDGRDGGGRPGGRDGGGRAGAHVRYVYLYMYMHMSMYMYTYMYVFTWHLVKNPFWEPGPGKTLIYSISLNPDFLIF